MTIAIYFNSAYSISAVKQMAAGFGSPERHRRTHRPKTLAVFLRLYHAVAGPQWAGCGREGLGPAGFLCHRSSNPATCLPTIVWKRGKQVNKPDIGGHSMATTSISARPEQTQSPIFNLAARAARKAARQWFAGIPTQSLAEWRDTCRLAHCDGLPNPKERGYAFDTAFACEIGNLIIAGGRAHV